MCGAGFVGAPPVIGDTGRAPSPANGDAGRTNFSGVATGAGSDTAGDTAGWGSGRGAAGISGCVFCGATGVDSGCGVDAAGAVTELPPINSASNCGSESAPNDDCDGTSTGRIESNTDVPDCGTSASLSSSSTDGGVKDNGFSSITLSYVSAFSRTCSDSGTGLETPNWIGLNAVSSSKICGSSSNKGFTSSFSSAIFSAFGSSIFSFSVNSTSSSYSGASSIGKRATSSSLRASVAME